MQHAVGPHVADAQRDRLRDAQTRRGNQPEHRDVEFAPQRVWPLMPQLPGGIQDAGDLIGRIDIRDRSSFPDREGIACRDLVARILGVEEAREQRQVPEALGSGFLRPARLRHPCQDRRGSDMRLAMQGGVPGERPQMARRLAQLVAEGSAQRDVAINISIQHGSLPPQGCAISKSKAISTLA